LSNLVKTAISFFIPLTTFFQYFPSDAVNGDVPYGAKVNWSFCDEQDIDSNPSDFEYERSYESPNTTSSDSRGSAFGSPDSYESVPVVRRGHYLPYTAHVETLSNQTRYSQAVESAKFDTTASNAVGFTSFGSADVSNALNYASRFSNYESKYSSSEPVASFANRTHGQAETVAAMDGMCKRTFNDIKPSVSLSNFENSAAVKFSPERTPPQQPIQSDAKRARTPSTLDTTAGSRSYRQQTSELINKLDNLLKFPSKPGSVSGSGGKAARGSGGKGRSRRPPRDLAKPRARNVVLKQAAELIWRIKCDEQVNFLEISLIYSCLHCLSLFLSYKVIFLSGLCPASWKFVECIS
jgi:hypothetical protein